MRSSEMTVFEKLITLIIFIGILFIGSSAIAADYPTKPITLYIPFTAGGSSDLTGRALAHAAAKFLGQPIICENKAGGGGTVGPSLVVVRPPDGYTTGISPGSATNAWVMGKLNFNLVEDLTPIIRYSAFVFGFVVRSDSPWKTIQDFVNYAKANPQKLTFGTGGVTTITYMAVEELSLMTGMKLVHMPFKGGADLNAALLGGHIDAISDSTSWGPLVDAGKFRLLVVYGAQRMPRYPNVPTLKESGYDLTFSSPLQIIGPKGMSKPIVAKLHSAFKRAMDDSAFLIVLKKYDMTLNYLGPEDLDMALHKESEQVRKIVQRLGLDK